MARPRKRAHETSTHNVDPTVTRVCALCNKAHKWLLSSTEKGQIRACKCGATFCSWRKPQWVYSSSEASAILQRERAEKAARLQARYLAEILPAMKRNSARKEAQRIKKREYGRRLTEKLEAAYNRGELSEEQMARVDLGRIWQHIILEGKMRRRALGRSLPERQERWRSAVAGSWSAPPPIARTTTSTTPTAQPKESGST